MKSLHSYASAVVATFALLNTKQAYNPVQHVEAFCEIKGDYTLRAESCRSCESLAIEFSKGGLNYYMHHGAFDGSNDGKNCHFYKEQPASCSDVYSPSSTSAGSVCEDVNIYTCICLCMRVYNFLSVFTYPCNIHVDIFRYSM